MPSASDWGRIHQDFAGFVPTTDIPFDIPMDMLLIVMV